MTPGLSLSLDLIRFCAAMVVFIVHFSYESITGGILWNPSTPFAHHAVVVFFVLSGIVMAHVVDCREQTAFTYFRARFARLYSVVLPMILIVPIADLIGAYVNHTPYDDAWVSTPVKPILAFLSAFTFLHESWGSARYFSNAPYWSVAYEFWYYVAFGVFCFLRGAWRWVSLAAVALVAGPKIVLLSPVWLFGVAVWRFIGHGRMPTLMAITVLALCLTCYAIWITTGLYELFEALGLILAKAMGIPTESLGWSWRWPADYFLGLLVAATFASIASLADHFERILLPFETPIRWLAGSTFTIYLLHYPLMHFFAAVMPGAPTNPLRVAAMSLLLVVTLFLIAALTERRKHVVASAIDLIADLGDRTKWTQQVR